MIYSCDKVKLDWRACYEWTPNYAVISSFTAKHGCAEMILSWLKIVLDELRVKEANKGKRVNERNSQSKLTDLCYYISVLQV